MWWKNTKYIEIISTEGDKYKISCKSILQSDEYFIFGVGYLYNAYCEMLPNVNL